MLWTSEDVQELLTTLYNRTDEEAARAVSGWEEAQGIAHRQSDALSHARHLAVLQVKAGAPGDDSGWAGVQALSTLAVAEELTAWRETAAPLVVRATPVAIKAVAQAVEHALNEHRGALLDALGDGSHLDGLKQAVRELPDALQIAITHGMREGRQR